MNDTDESPSTPPDYREFRRGLQFGAGIAVGIFLIVIAIVAGCLFAYSTNWLRF